MTLPAFLFGIFLSTLYGVVFHLFRGGGLGRLTLYIILAWVGFWIGQLAASFFDINLLNVGPLHLGIATITSWIFLGVGHWLSRVETDKDQTKA